MYAHALRILALVSIFVFTGLAFGQSHPRWEQVWIPAEEKGFGGRIEEIKLDAALYRPAGVGPFPLVIWNHGSTDNGRIPDKNSERDAAPILFFLDRGFAIILPMRRGRGQSGGYNGEQERYWDHAPNLAGVERAIEDVDAVVAYAKTQPLFDTSRLVIGGVSRGGLLSVVYAARRSNLPIKAVVNYVGGWTNDRGPYDFVGAMFKEAGATLKVPSIWIYGRRDTNYTDDSIQSYAAKFREAGGEMTFRFYNHDLKDGHFILTQWELWVPDMNPFFRLLGYPYLKR